MRMVAKQRSNYSSRKLRLSCKRSRLRPCSRCEKTAGKELPARDVDAGRHSLIPLHESPILPDESALLSQPCAIGPASATQNGSTSHSRAGAAPLGEIQKLDRDARFGFVESHILLSDLINESKLLPAA